MLRIRRGFTLIEFVVVVAITGVLIALLLPAINAVRNEARKEEKKTSDEKAAAVQAARVMEENGGIEQICRQALRNYKEPVNDITFSQIVRLPDAEAILYVGKAADGRCFSVFHSKFSAGPEAQEPAVTILNTGPKTNADGE